MSVGRRQYFRLVMASNQKHSSVNVLILLKLCLEGVLHMPYTEFQLCDGLKMHGLLFCTIMPQGFLLGSSQQQQPIKQCPYNFYLVSFNAMAVLSSLPSDDCLTGCTSIFSTAKPSDRFVRSYGARRTLLRIV